MTTSGTASSVLAEPIELPCGLVLPNRILKAAMGEGLADPWTAEVTPALIRLYERWAAGGSGTLITGVLCVERRAMDSVFVTVDDASDLDGLRRWAGAVHRREVRLLGQLQHPGRQVPRYMARHPVAPSALPPLGGSRLFSSSRALTSEEIEGLIRRFADAAVLVEQAGFDGIELHAAHGYLIGQFLSPETNRRTDEWGGDLARRSRFLLEIIRAVRARVDPRFAVAVKINASDFRPGGFDLDDSAHVVGRLGAEGVDLIEISGGTFESDSGCLSIRPGEPGTTKEAYFAGMAPRLRAMTEVPLALTGGLRSKHVMERLLEEGTVDLIGLGRPLIQQPDLSSHLLGGTAQGIDLLPRPAHGVSELFWWIGQFRRLAAGEDLDPAYTLRRSQLDATRSMARQVVANLRSSARDVVGR